MPQKILLLGSGELGKELVIALQRLGRYVVAVDHYAGAPAMQVAHAYEVCNMLDGAALDAVVNKHRPDIIVPEIEAIRTERFFDYERNGIQVVPSARAANITMNRKSIRNLAAFDLNLKTAAFEYAAAYEDFEKDTDKVFYADFDSKNPLKNQEKTPREYIGVKPKNGYPHEPKHLHHKNKKKKKAD